MEGWRAVQGSEPPDEPGMVFMTILAGKIEDFNKEWLAARVVTRPALGHRAYDSENLENGIIALIRILQDKLEALRGQRAA